jgi:hypothetical protein
MKRWDAIGFFCEDVRQEVSGTETIVGVMPDNVAIQGQPGGSLPKLGMYVRIHITTDLEVKTISVTADFFDGANRQVIGIFDEAQIAQEKDKARSSGAHLIGFVFRAILSPFPVSQFGRILLRAKIGEDEAICGGLNIVPSSS